MDIMTMAMCKPKVIDLDKYGLSDIMFALFSQGGGGYESDVPIELWKELDENKVHIVRFSVPSMGIRFMTSNTAVIKSYIEDWDYDQGNLHFEFTMRDETTLRVSVMISEIVSNNRSDGFLMTLNLAEI